MSDAKRPFQTELAEGVPTSDQPLAIRSAVPAGLEYGEYKRYLRWDFIFSCAYCGITEAEAQSIRFTIDHYEPQAVRQDLVHEYSNLMYACDECNQRKGDRCPPQSARSVGIRFFRADQDLFRDHFQLSPPSTVLVGTSKAGEYTIDAIDLNRQSTRRLRELRYRLTKCDRFVAEGVSALRSFPIDQLPSHIRAQANRAIQQTTGFVDKLAEDIDRLLADFARSPLADEDPDAEARARDRAKRLKALEGLHPGSWRGPRKKKTKHGR